MINIFHWETEWEDRCTSVENLIKGSEFDQVELNTEPDERTIKDLNHHLFKNISEENVNILLAHTSNLDDKNDFLSIITHVNEQYPSMLIVLYSGGDIYIEQHKKKIRIGDKTFDVNFYNKQNIVAVKLGGHGNKDFSEEIHLEAGLNALLKTKDKNDFFDAITKKDKKLEADISNRHFGFQGINLLTSLDNVPGIQLLILWDIIDENDPEFENKDDLILNNHKIVFSSEQLQNLLSDPDKLTQYDAILIIPELNWGDHRSRFDGLRIAAELRQVHKYLAPIILISCFTMQDFEEFYEFQCNSKFNIAFAPSTYLLKLGNKETAGPLLAEIDAILKHLKPLHKATLQDINTMLLNETGDLIDRLTHILFINKPKKDIEWVLEYAGRILGEQAPGLKDLLKRILYAHVAGNDHEFTLLKDELIFFFTNMLNNKPNSLANLTDDEAKEKLKILIIEDSAQYQKVLKLHLSDRFDLMIFSIGEEAIKYLRENDPSQQIACVISDWRLFKDNSKNVWQEMQGYEILSEIAFFHPASLVSLTSEIDKNVHAIRNLLGINITLFKKQYLQSSDPNDKLWDMFADSIEDLCLQATNLIGSQPTGGNWVSENAKNKFVSFKTKYLHQRRTAWPTFEKNISDIADKCWNYYKGCLAGTGIYLRSYEDEFGLKLGDSLENILIIRRLWLALWFQKSKIYDMGRVIEKVPEIKMYVVLKGIELEFEKEKIDSVTYQRNYKKGDDDSPYIPEWASKLETNADTFCSTLCIKAKSLPGLGILPEEKAWLTRNGIDFSKNANDFEEEDDDDNF